ncbi:MAG: hypothetical protein ACFFCW_02780 [Candidatus Hodarchaeota archaeon]
MCQGIKGFVEEFNKASPGALVFLKAVQNSRIFRVGRGRVRWTDQALDRKAKYPQSNIVPVEVCLFSPASTPTSPVLNPPSVKN